MGSKLGAKQRLTLTTAIYFAFFVAELVVAIRTRSLALTADAFHYLNDLIGFAVALAALIAKQRKISRHGPLTFGWQRAPVVGAFFNGTFLLALGISIFFQSIERFIGMNKVDDTLLILVLGCVGLTLNIISAAILHGHHSHGHGHCCCSGHQDTGNPRLPKDDSSIDLDDALDESIYRQLHGHHNHAKQPGSIAPVRDLGMLGVMIHVICDAINNLGVIVAATIMSFTAWEQRFLADPAASTCISLMIIISAFPLVKSSGKILLQSAPTRIDVREVQEDLELIPGIDSVHELHIWQLDESKTVASAHLVFTDSEPSNFTASAQTARECLHAYGIHSATLQPEFLHPQLAGPYRNSSIPAPCQAVCSKGCEDLMCCAERAEPNEKSRSSSGSVVDSAASTLYAASLDKVDKL